MQTILSPTFLILFAVLLLGVTLLLVFLPPWFDRYQGSEQNIRWRQPDGAPRSVFALLYLLYAWAALVFLLPLVLTFQSRLSLASDRFDLWLQTAKILVPIAILFLVFLFGANHGFLRWISDPEWPNSDDKKGDREKHGQ